MDSSKDFITATEAARRKRVSRQSLAARQPLASLSAPYQRGGGWSRARAGANRFPPARSGKGTNGPRSLVAMCLRKLADNFDAAPESSIRCFPEKLQLALWKELTMSLHAWDTLSSCLLSASISRASRAITENKTQQDTVTGPVGIYRYCEEIIDPPRELSVYTAPLRALEGCLVYLCIDNVARFETYELFALATLPQLAVLELAEDWESTANGIGDWLPRGWSELGDGAFTGLRVLKITSERHTVSERWLQKVLEFPRLEIFDITTPWPSRLRHNPRVSRIAADCGWKVAVSRGSLFVSYAEAYLDGRTAVHPSCDKGLTWLFDNGRRQVALVDDPRARIYERYNDEVEANKQAGLGPPNKPDLSTYLDDGWQTLLQNGLPGSATTDTQASKDEDMSDDQVFWTNNQVFLTDDQAFWFLALLDQKEYKKDRVPIQAQMAGVTLAEGRFVSLRLHNSSRTAEQRRRHRTVGRILFSRSREEANANAGSKSSPRPRPPKKTEPHLGPAAPSWAPRRDDRRETNLKPRKKQKTVGDLLPSFS
ncbi:hypothetical protein C8A00DRAFT_11477 [Chaetomidium leptoderma]|uniref:Uncharacterized protein n=1 Tax=Chaetomidium leptoderma TaxID=669021 RepID=A0AAN6VX10_9PEZI|nr:hypothetical protein C8A00DRAFT_11477 [Chaetomidium leptoderma]